MLYCPFCREAFEDSERCPDHDIALVPLRELRRFSGIAAADEQPLPWWSPQRARGVVALGAVVTLIAFVCPFGSLVGEVELTNTLLALARGRAARLWVVPMAAIALLLLLYRRRSPAALRSARLAALFVSLLPSCVVTFTWLGAREAADAMSIKQAAYVQFQLGSGAWLVWASGLLLTWGSLRLGLRNHPSVG